MVTTVIKIIMCGCNGKMGHVISDIVEKDEESVMVAGLDIVDNDTCGYPVFTDYKKCEVDADVVIDFSSSKGTDNLLDFCLERKLPLVLCTTGLSEEQLARVKEASKQIPILKSANMSLGINTIMKLLREATKILAPAGYDIEIVEKHHNQKVDAPSGTALALADVINEQLDNEYEYKFDRSKDRIKRPKKEIGISAVRGGTIVGDHDVIFAGIDEVIEINHRAYSKAVFGKGAVQAAKFIAGKQPGMYDMSDVID